MVSIRGKKGIRELIADPARSYKIAYRELTLPSARRLDYPVHLAQDLTPEFQDRQEVAYKPLYSASMENGHVIGQGNVISPDGFVVDDATPKYDRPGYHNKVSLLKGKTAVVPPRYVDGRLLVLSATYDDSYYHWLYHALPRLSLASDFSFDRIYVNNSLRFHREYLDLLGVPAERVIPAANDAHLQARELVFTSFLSTLNDRALAPLREMSTTYGQHGRRDRQRIYISRNDTPNRRTLVNECEVFAFLRTEGFERYELTGLPVREQIELFSSASFVVGPHGAGMGNIVFCQAGARVVEIFDPSYVHPCMWMQVPSLNLQYGYVVGEGEKDLSRPLADRLHKPVTVNVEKFKALYDRVKEGPSSSERLPGR